MPISWDEHDWPVARYHASGALTTADIQGMLDQVGAYLGRRQRFGILTTVQDASRSDPGTAKLQARWAARHVDELKAYVVGWASVVEPDELDFQRKRLDSMNALVPFTLAAFASERECVDWLRDRL
jgi:hypothetical protein